MALHARAATKEEVRFIVREELTSMRETMLLEVRDAIRDRMTPRGMSQRVPSKSHNDAIDIDNSRRRAHGSEYRKLNDDDDQKADRNSRSSAKEFVLAYEDGTVHEPLLMQLHSAVESQQCELVSASVAILNAIWVGMETDYHARQVDGDGSGEPPIGKFVNNAFCAFFTSEILLKICVNGRAFFCKCPEARWNWFDILVVGSQLMETIIGVIMTYTGSKRHVEGGFFNILRMLRMVRILRVARLASTLIELRKLVTSIAASLIPLCWTLLLIFLSIYMFAILITHVVTNRLKANDIDEAENKEELVEFFGTLPRAMITLYMIISEGIHWGEVMKPLAEDISPWLRPAICLFVAFQLFAMMNVITAYFVDAAFKSANDNERREVSENLLLAVAQAQADERGDKKHRKINVDAMTITKGDFQKFLDSDHMYDFCDLLQIEPEEAEMIYDLIDTQGSGSLSSKEFRSGCYRLVGPAKAEMTARISFEQRQYWTQITSELEELRRMIMKEKDNEAESSPYSTVSTAADGNGKGE
eukprot:TRINITY_DN48328_c0_g1_i1.p1 TRINITY_DN48328_c0_g1~~TRINITY_DN48328_c0_g1_i1.p1  ORF type:complete len:531 (-),score=112.57 TRINITY_DN48328_c0_g1_i1:164-1756(-)